MGSDERYVRNMRMREGTLVITWLRWLPQIEQQKKFPIMPVEKSDSELNHVHQAFV